MEVIPMVRGLSVLKARTTVVSDEICPGQSWTYSFEITDEMLGLGRSTTITEISG